MTFQPPAMRPRLPVLGHPGTMLMRSADRRGIESPFFVVHAQPHRSVRRRSMKVEGGPLQRRRDADAERSSSVGYSPRPTLLCHGGHVAREPSGGPPSTPIGHFEGRTSSLQVACTAARRRRFPPERVRRPEAVGTLSANGVAPERLVRAAQKPVLG